MADVYYQLVKAGERNINQVPAKHRAEVQALLDADVQSQAAPSTV